MQAIIKTGGLIPPTLFISPKQTDTEGSPCLPAPHYIISESVLTLFHNYSGLKIPAWLRVRVSAVGGLGRVLEPELQVTVNLRLPVAPPISVTEYEKQASEK
jgi:hypothetical protein